MKLSVDRKNRCVIATGSFKGRKIKAIAVCHPDDVFDEDVGKRIATMKYKVKYLKTKMEFHDAKIKWLNQGIEWAKTVILDETRISLSIKKRLDELSASVNEEIQKYYK